MPPGWKVDQADTRDQANRHQGKLEDGTRLATPVGHVCRDAGRLGASLAVRLAEHPDEHRPERPVLLAVDQQLGEGRAQSRPSTK